jgi:hypothetical protein
MHIQEGSKMVCNADTAGLLENFSSKQKKESKGEPPPFDPEAGYGWTPRLQMFHPMFLGCHGVTVSQIIFWHLELQVMLPCHCSQFRLT